MTLKSQDKSSKNKVSRPTHKRQKQAVVSTHPAQSLQRISNPTTAVHIEDIQALHSTIGNHAVKQLIQTKRKPIAPTPVNKTGSVPYQNKEIVARTPQTTTRLFNHTSPSPQVKHHTSNSLQRTTLISKSQAQTEGGVEYRGHWAKYLAGLKAYRTAQSRANQAAQIRALSQLQTAGRGVDREIKAIIEGDPNGALDTRLATRQQIIATQRPLIKLAYYKLVTVHQLAPLALNASDMASTFRDQIETNLDEIKGRYKQRMGLDDDSPSEANNIQVDAYLRRLQNSKLTVNVQAWSLPYYIESGEVKQVWELDLEEKRYQDDHGVGRAATEELFGYSSTVSEQDRENRPISCGVNVFNSPSGAASQYGPYFFQLKDQLKERVVYTYSDSLTHRARLAGRGMIGTTNRLESVLANHTTLLGIFASEQLDEYVVDDDRQGSLKTEKKRFSTSNYVEALAFGGISLARDVESFHVPYRSRTDLMASPDGAHVDALSQKYNLHIVYYK